ncbi:MAG TPA: PIN domain-containing protein [Chthoniobacter sp.]|jgi:predicted nucleic acid-binding protein
MRFADTNILLYSVSQDPGESRKAETAVALLRTAELCLSVQVLQEFYVQATRPNRPDALSHREAMAFIATWLRYPVQSITVPVMQAALATKERWGISYWDAAIIEAARAAGCDEVLSEDLNHLQSYGGIRVTNPFL